jgi:hypothetical protein
MRPDMSEGQQAVCEEAADFLRAAQDEEYMLRTARDNLEARWDRLIAAWGVLPLAPAWEQRSVCDEVLRQVFDLLISQLYLLGGRLEMWPRGSYRDMVDRGESAIPLRLNLLTLVPWGQRALGALMGTDLVQLSWHYAEEHMAFSLI